jgi:Zn-finger nucleic acid-binding protein
VSCPRCNGALTARDDIGPGVLGSSCGAFFVTGDARKKLIAWLHVSEETWAFVLSQGKRGPKCDCGQAMATSTLKGVEIDGCASCGGLLLDHGELTKLTGLDEGPVPEVASAVMPERETSLGREFTPSRAALAGFSSTRRFHLLQAKSSPAPGVVAPINEPFEWTVSNGLTTGSITAFDDSTARQLLAFVTGNLVSSRFVLRDGRDNPVLVFLRRTKALVYAEVEVRYADDDELIGTVTSSLARFSVDAKDARDRVLLHFDKGILRVLTFVVKRGAEEIGTLARQLNNIEMDASLLGGYQIQRSLHREDYELNVVVDLTTTESALALGALFLIAQASHGAIV